jgi:transcriptional regulator of arginine metabolism
MKTQRHNAIRDLLGNTSANHQGTANGRGGMSPQGTIGSPAAISSQEALRRKLAARGIHVTQATLSRDIRELKLMKGPSGYELPSDFDQDEDDLPEIARVLADFGLEVRQAQNLLILLTTMGGAQPVAASLDYEEWTEVVGTVAGDNTVLIVCPNARQASTLKARIEAHLV